MLETIAQNAARVCGASDAIIRRVEGDAMTPAAHFGTIPVSNAPVPRPITRNSVAGRALLEGRTIHIHDTLEPEFVREYPEGAAIQQREGYRAVVVTPLLRDSNPIGMIAIRRMEPQPFSDTQIALLETFANQAVIAIENTRLFNEIKEALEQQTATADILRVISGSPTDVQPVFEAIAERATRLCGAVNGLVFRFDGELIHVAAHHNIGGAELDAILSVFPIRPGRGSVAGRAIESRRLVHVEDLAQDPEYEQARVVQAGFRTALSVPMLRGGVPIGTINVMRMAVAPFSPGQIALLQTFADQAVIAIENVRLFNETKEALEQQTATSEILRVIAASPTDVQPVFDTIVESAARLCHAANAGVFLTDGRTLDLPANYGSASPEALATIRSQYPRPVDQETTAGVAILTRSVIHVPDIEAPSTAEVYTRRVGRLLGVRSMVAVPMMRKGEVVGAINLSRQEPGRFSDMEVELLKTFADQAVIAIENVRLFSELQSSNRELRTALDTQTATSDILRVISRSQTDVQPVFDAIVASAVRLLGAYSGVLTRVAGDQIELAALTSTDDAADAAQRALYPRSLHSEGMQAQVMRDRAPVNIVDFQTDPRVSEAARAAARVRGTPSLVAVPLLRHDEAIGAIAVSRREPGGFTEDEIALLKTFADQAVIAIENVRLFTELQTRTRELTRLSSSRRRSEWSVMQSLDPRSRDRAEEILAKRLACRARNGGLAQYDGERGSWQRPPTALTAKPSRLCAGSAIRKGEG